MVLGVRVVKVVTVVQVVRRRDLMVVQRLTQFERYVTEEAPVDHGRTMAELERAGWLQPVRWPKDLMIQMVVWDGQSVAEVVVTHRPALARHKKAEMKVAVKRRSEVEQRKLSAALELQQVQRRRRRRRRREVVLPW